MKIKIDDMPVRNATLTTLAFSAAIGLLIGSLFDRDWLLSVIGFALSAVTGMRIVRLLMEEESQARYRRIEEFWNRKVKG